MDIKREIRVKPFWRKYWYLMPISLVIVAAGVVKSTIGNASYIVEKADIQTAKVTQGTFRVEVRGVGALKTNNKRWISSQVSGRVEQILVKPGAKVSNGQLLLRLSNPDLRRELEKAKWELKATRAESRAAYVALESQLVELDNQVQEAKFAYQSAKLKLDAETELLAQGRASISKLDYQRSELASQRQFYSWQAAQGRYAKMKDNLEANQFAQQARVGLVENNYHRIKDQVDNLNLTASAQGIVQQISLQLGQQLQTGASVALIADPDSLIAELNIQELQVKDIIEGQQVIIDTRTSEILGRVSRIDPAVVAGMVQVDVLLSGDLPSEARPDLNVEGRIEISHIENALFVRRPAFAPSFDHTSIYRISSDGHRAVKQTVQLGQSSVNQVQILTGLNVGDSIIVSDATAWQQHNEILLH